MPGNETVIVDSDGLIGFINDKDVLHERCLRIFAKFQRDNFNVVVPYAIVLEAATALVKDKEIRRPDLANQLLKDFSDTEAPLGFEEKVGGLVAEIYNPKTSKKNSPFDHYVLALAKKNKIKYVFSFDEFYKKNGLKLVEELSELIREGRKFE